MENTDTITTKDTYITIKASKLVDMVNAVYLADDPCYTSIVLEGIIEEMTSDKGFYQVTTEDTTNAKTFLEIGFNLVKYEIIDSVQFYKSEYDYKIRYRFYSLSKQLNHNTLDIIDTNYIQQLQLNSYKP